MNIFSLDCSTTNASACILCDNKVVRSSTWYEERARHEGLFEIAEQLLADSGWTWPDIDLFTVGRGPGAYSGLRVSLLAAQALAAPGNSPVVAVSSMEALAARLIKDNGLDEITIVGDARRNSVWYGRCVAGSSAKWKVTPATNAPGELSHTSVIATPHWEALQTLRKKITAPQWLDGPQIPTAEDIATLAAQRMSDAAEQEPLLPLYLHPAV